MAGPSDVEGLVVQSGCHGRGFGKLKAVGHFELVAGLHHRKGSLVGKKVNVPVGCNR